MYIFSDFPHLPQGMYICMYVCDSFPRNEKKVIDFCVWVFLYYFFLFDGFGEKMRSNNHGGKKVFLEIFFFFFWLMLLLVGMYKCVSVCMMVSMFACVYVRIIWEVRMPTKKKKKKRLRIEQRIENF